VSVSVASVCASVLPCPEVVIVALSGNWLPSLRLDRSRLRSLSASFDLVTPVHLSRHRVRGAHGCVSRPDLHETDPFVHRQCRSVDANQQWRGASRHSVFRLGTRERVVVERLYVLQLCLQCNPTDSISRRQQVSIKLGSAFFLNTIYLVRGLLRCVMQLINGNILPDLNCTQCQCRSPMLMP
jgi:hypothetical protein